MSSRRLVLVTGAAGYVGGRLLPALLARGGHVRCLARRPEAIKGRCATTASGCLPSSSRTIWSRLAPAAVFMVAERTGVRPNLGVAAGLQDACGRDDGDHYQRLQRGDRRDAVQMLVEELEHELDPDAAC